MERNFCGNFRAFRSNKRNLIRQKIQKLWFAKVYPRENLFLLDFSFYFKILFWIPTFELNICQFYSSSVVIRQLLANFSLKNHKYKDKSTKRVRIFFLANYFERLDSRNIILAKLKKNWRLGRFTNISSHESFYPLMF